MAWSLDFDSEAAKDLAKMDGSGKRRIIYKLDWLLENFDNLLPQPLSAELRDFYKLRVGDWRVVYKINWSKKLITVCYVDWRDKVYKKR